MKLKFNKAARKYSIEELDYHEVVMMQRELVQGNSTCVELAKEITKQWLRVNVTQDE